MNYRHMWVNPPEIAIVEISYQKEDDDEGAYCK